MGIPAQSYIMLEEIDQDVQLIKTFFKLITKKEASLPKEIGFEFMWKDINNQNRVKIINCKEQS